MNVVAFTLGVGVCFPPDTSGRLARIDGCREYAAAASVSCRCAAVATAGRAVSHEMQKHERE